MDLTGTDAQIVRPYSGYTSRRSTTDAQIVRPYSGYTSRRSTTDAQIVRPYISLHVSPTEEIGNRLGANENSPRRAEIKVRKNEMKLRKKEIKVPKNFFIPPWMIFIFHRGNFDFLGGVGD